MATLKQSKHEQKVRTLHLTLKKQWFDLMVKGKKKIEFRKPSKWIKQRLLGKDYDYVMFVNGYGNDKPYFICKYKGYEVSRSGGVAHFKDVELRYRKGDLLIYLGKIIEKGNLE